jgi:hypothetical protein
MNFQTYVALSFQIRNDLSDTEVVVEESADLSTWVSSAVLVSVVDAGDGLVRYTYRSSGARGDKKGFLRPTFEQTVICPNLA